MALLNRDSQVDHVRGLTADTAQVARQTLLVSPLLRHREQLTPLGRIALREPHLPHLPIVSKALDSKDECIAPKEVARRASLTRLALFFAFCGRYAFPFSF
jgi:hypothetical protein